MDFCDRLSELKQSRGATLSQLAEAVGISTRAIKYYASGEREPSLSTLIALADYFDVSLDYLVGRSEDPARR